MKFAPWFLLVSGLTLARIASAQAQQAPDINTILMRSTFKISGPPGSMGTAFILGKPSPTDSRAGYYVLVTAAHVLDSIRGESATLRLRRKVGDGFAAADYEIRIRRGSTALWTRHPSADVAVMYIPFPPGADIALLPTGMLATDETLRQFELHPGDRLSSLGYPLGAEGNDGGLPILRSGYIASYPLLPTAAVRSFLFDFNVFEGNSGGPVYFVESNRTYGGALRLETVQFLVGLVSEQRFADEPTRSLYEQRVLRHRLGLAVVIHAALINEALALLPPSP